MQVLLSTAGLAWVQVRFFSQHDSMYLEGPCLVVYNDGSVAQGYIPQDDYR